MTEGDAIPRVRRSSKEIRSLILTAAQDVFSERGYAGASTREVSIRAGVTERLLFKHFGTKAKLFDEAVLVPFEQFLGVFHRTWLTRAVGGPVENIALECVSALYDFLHTHRTLISVLLAARAHEPAFDQRLERLFHLIEKITQEGMAERRFFGQNSSLVTRFTFGLILAAAVHEDLLFANGPMPQREELLLEMNQFILHGVAHR